MIKKYVEMGMGISIVTGVCLSGSERLASISLERYFPKRSYGIVVRRGKFLTPQAQCFIKMMDENYTFEAPSEHDGAG